MQTSKLNSLYIMLDSSVLASMQGGAWIDKSGNYCFCGTTPTCSSPAGFFNLSAYESTGIYVPPEPPIAYVTGFVAGCYALESLLQSTLECFFDQECLNTVVQFFSSSNLTNVEALNENVTQFPRQTTIGVILRELFIENWVTMSSFENYFAQCAPISSHLKLKDRVRVIWYWLKTQTLELNMFNSEETWHNDYFRRISVISTRVYLLLLTIALIILITNNTLTIQTQQFTVNEPSQATFEQLQANSKYSSTLECPCQKIAIAFNSFIFISVHFHQFCSSDFVVKSSEWMNLLYYRWVAFFYSYDDFRLFVLPHFRLLISFCTLANDTIVSALGQFSSNTLISSRAQSRQTIETQVTTAIDRLRRSTSATFIRMLDFVRHMAHGNGIVSSTLSNWHFLSLNTSVSWTALWAESRSYGNCSCGANPTCTSPAFIDQWPILGFRVGCDPLESLLQSTLACLYDVSCINRIQFMYYSSNLTMHPLNRTLSAPSATVKSLLNQLM
ncbi:unnamed protein product, partial [Rotaria sp. Silwood2]